MPVVASLRVGLPTGFLEELSLARSQEDVLVSVARWMSEIVPSERASIALPHDGFNLQIYALAGATILPQGTMLSMDRSLVGAAFEHQEVIRTHDLLTSSASEARRLVDAGLRSAIVCPLVSSGRSLGTLNLGNSRPGFFTEEHGVILRSIADLIAAFLAVHQMATNESRRADTDALTQCLNRQAVIDVLEDAFDNDVRPPSVLYIDFDGFKAINDAHGHLHGDEVLRILSKRIRGVIRDFDALGRLGGDEFLVVVRRDGNGRTAQRLAERIRDACASPITVHSIQLRPGLSIGIATATAATTSALELLQDADAAMYDAKRDDDRAISVADDDIRRHAAMVSTVDLDLDFGMASGQITFHFQPVCDLVSRRIMGAEALIRWNHPRLGWIPAPLLVERLEVTGRTNAFTRFSLNTIAAMWNEVRSRVPWLRHRPVAMNLTPRQLSWEGYADFHRTTMSAAGLDSGSIIVEVVESSEINPGDAAETTLQQLGDQHVKIALDDFGVGHNALGYFTMFPIHAIKFDRSLVGVVAQSEQIRTILGGLTSMSHQLGVLSIGEGIETETEATICTELGIVRGQGWHFGKPASLEDFIALALDEGPPPGMATDPNPAHFPAPQETLSHFTR